MAQGQSGSEVFSASGAGFFGSRARGMLIDKCQYLCQMVAHHRQPSLGGTSWMNREVHVLICGRLG
jgi:hypothetical protein